MMQFDFEPFFLKYCSYFPYNAKLCINGHEYLKRQLQKEGIRFEPLDNGLLSCENPERAQDIADGLSAEKICDLLKKWQERQYAYEERPVRAARHGRGLSLRRLYPAGRVLSYPGTG